jgi:small subunit ribosomal protein S17
MAKILQGKVISNKMTGTVIVEVERTIPHPLFKKLLKRSKKFKVATNGQKVKVGVSVKIIETRPIAKDKHFALISEENKAKKEKKS